MITDEGIMIMILGVNEGAQSRDSDINHRLQEEVERTKGAATESLIKILTSQMTHVCLNQVDDLTAHHLRHPLLSSPTAPRNPTHHHHRHPGRTLAVIGAHHQDVNTEAVQETEARKSRGKKKEKRVIKRRKKR